MEFVKPTNMPFNQWPAYKQQLEEREFGKKIWNEICKSDYPVVFGPIEREEKQIDPGFMKMRVTVPVQVVPYRKIELPKFEYVALELSFLERLKYLFTNRLPIVGYWRIN